MFRFGRYTCNQNKLQFRGFPACPLDVLASCEPTFSQRYCPPLSGLSVSITVAQCGGTLTRWRLLPAPDTAGRRSLIAAYCRGYRSSGQPGKTRKRWPISVRPARPLRAVCIGPSPQPWYHSMHPASGRGLALLSDGLLDSWCVCGAVAGADPQWGWGTSICHPSRSIIRVARSGRASRAEGAAPSCENDVSTGVRK